MDKAEITHKIIGCAFKVHSALGAGLLPTFPTYPTNPNSDNTAKLNICPS